MVVSLEYVAKSKSAMPLEKLLDTEFSPKGSKVHVFHILDNMKHLK